MNYSLLDSGDGERLEQFGDRVIRRPARSAIWRRSQPESVWSAASAAFNHKTGWGFSGPKFESWEINLQFANLLLRLQKNGQLGMFPEHLNYLDLLSSFIRTTDGGPAKVLNLFAYTGVATIYCALHGAHVTHVDLSKSALQWSEENLRLNGIAKEQVRFIKDDAVEFLARESRRESRYDLIILDPPSFSRPTKGSSWELEGIFPDLIGKVCGILAPKHGSVLCTSHHQGITRFGAANLLYDELGAKAIIEHRELALKEAAQERYLDSGYLVSASINIGKR